MNSTHAHPQPLLDMLTQYGAAALLALIAISVPLQLVLAFAGAPIFVLTTLFTLLFAPFLMMLLAATPAVTVGPGGLTVQPRLGKARAVTWPQVAAIKPYPLLPPPDAELSRKYLAGRGKYRPAEGLMLVIPTLPAQYRIAGVLAGEGLTPVIAVTTRTHDRYEVLVKKIRAYAEEAAA
jgi:hypothetical protein